MVDKKIFLRKDGCPNDLFFRDQPFPFEYMKEVSEEVALRNPSKVVLYNFSNDEVKAFFCKSKDVLNSAMSHEPIATVKS